MTDKDRAGRAPYNFVPLPKALRPVGKPPSGDRYHCNLLSGEIHLTLEALTDFYVRGMWTLPQFRTKTVQDGDAERPVEVKDQTLPFCVDGELRIPGSSIRGMIRSLVEILGCSPLDPINDNPLFFRAVRASTYPEKPWFEPQAKTYRKRLGRKVRAGYLYGGPEHWVIRPAKNNKGDQPFYKIKRDQDWTVVRDFWFTAHGERAYASREGERGAVRGTLVCTGPMKAKNDGKSHQWVINDEGDQPPITIPTRDVEAYLRTGVTEELRAHPEFI